MASVKTVTPIVLEEVVFKAATIAAVDVEDVVVEVAEAIVMTDIRVVIQSMVHHASNEEIR